MKKVFNLYNIFLVLILGLISVLTLKTTEVEAAGTVNWPNGSTVTISRTVENVYNAPEVEFTYKIVTAVFDMGANVNKKMKNVANNTTTMNLSSTDTAIQAIKRGNALPSGFTPTTGNTVSASTSDYPIYIWFESATGTLYYYSEADKVYLNPTQGGTSFFQKMQSLTDISGLSEIDVSTANRMSNMFNGCTSLTNIDALSNWDTSAVTIMNMMFYGCTSLTNINGARNWDTSKVTNMIDMFENCTSLTNINALSNWDTSSATTMTGMFWGCSSLTNINGASNWNTSSIDNVSAMFYGCSKASGTIQILNSPSTSYSAIFDGAATEPGAQIIVNYSSNVTNIDNIIAAKSSNSNVVKGSVVSIPQGSGSGSGTTPTAVNGATITFNGSETVSNSYTVTKSTTLDLSNVGLKIKQPGIYDLTIKEIASSNPAYPTTNTEYTVTIQVQNVLDNNNMPTGNFTATYVIKDANDNKVNSMSFAHPKDESYFGHIELTKTVKGIMADSTKYFDFSVQVDDATSDACASYTGSEKYPVTGVDAGHFSSSEVTKCKSGTKDSLSLKTGQTAKIGQFNYNNTNYDSISIDDYYKIVEANESGYTTTFKVNSGSETSGVDIGSNSITHAGNVVTFYNQKEGSPVTGIIFTILPYLLLVGIGAGGLILFKKKRKIEVI